MAPRAVYFVDIVEDYPQIGGVVEYSRNLRQALKARFGSRLISVRDMAARLGCSDPGEPYLDRERRAIQALAAAHPHSIILVPNFQNPLQRVPGRERPEVINVVHDVQFCFLPDLFDAGQLQWLHAAFAETRENADEIVFVSRTTRDQYIQRFGAPRRFEVIHPPIRGRTTSVRPTKRKSFLLAVQHATCHPHKNLAGLLELFSALALRRPDLTLRIVGHGKEMVAAEIARMPLAIRCRIEHLGYVPRRTLDDLYGSAVAFVSLSRFEGFNMSAAEAATHGTPMILSDLPVHQELHLGRACVVDAGAPCAESICAYLDVPPVGLPLGQASEHFSVSSASGNRFTSLIEALDAMRAWSPGRMPGPCRSVAPLRQWVPPQVQRRKLAGVVLAGTLVSGFGLMPVQAAMAPSPPCPKDVTLPSGGDGGGSGGLGGPGASGCAGTGGTDGASGGGGGGSAGGGQGGFGSGGGAGGVGGNNTEILSPTPALPISGSVGLPGSGGGDNEEGGGGGGGGGGYVINGQASLTIPAQTDDKTASLSGGQGGAGGSGYFGGGGSGGAGGAGLFQTSTTQSVVNAGLIQGGKGGDGGDKTGGSEVGQGGNGGNGGNGGVGLFLSARSVLTNTGSIVGGAGGAAGSGPTSGAVGAGGVGIIGQDITIIDSGTISGGMQGSTYYSENATHPVVDEALTSHADSIYFTGGSNVLTLQTGWALVGDIALNGSLTFNQTDAVDLTTRISNLSPTNDILSGSIIQNGTGTLILSAKNTYTGGTTVSQGKLSLGLDGAAGTGAIILSGGTLDATYTGTLANALSVGQTASAAFGAASGKTVTLTGAVTLGASSTFNIGSSTDSGTVIVASSAAVADPTSRIVIGGGLVQAASGIGALGTLTAAAASTTIDAGTLDFNGNNATIANLLGGGGGTLTNAAGATVTVNAGSYAGLIAGGGALAKAGGGALLLSGANAYSGGTQIVGGTLGVANNQALGSGLITFGGGTLQAAVNGLAIANAAMLGPTGTIDTQGFSVTYAGAIGGAGSLTKLGAGSLVLSGANGYSGGTQFGTGLVSLAHATAGVIDAAGSGGITLGGGTLETAAIGTLANAVTLSQGAGAVLGASAGTTATLTGPIALRSGASLTFGSASDPGTIVVSGPNGSVDQTARLAIGGGIVRAGAGSAALGNLTSAAASTTIDAGTLDFNGNSATIANLLGAGGALTNAAGAVTTIDAGAYSGSITGGMALAKASGGTLLLSGPNSYSGGTQLGAGTLSLAHVSNGIIDAVGTGGVSLAGGTLESKLTGTLNPSLSVTGPASIGALGGTTLTLAGGFAVGSGAAVTFGTLADSGTVVLASTPVSVASSAALILNAGTLRAAAGNAALGTLTASVTSVTVNGGTLDFNGNNATIGQLKGAAGQITNAGGTRTTIKGGSYSGQITGGTTLVVSGGGVLNLSGNNSYTGGTLVRSGVIEVGSATALGTGALSLDEGTTLAFAADGLDFGNAIKFTGLQDPTIDTGASSQTVSGVISGPGALTKQGTGTLTLTAQNTYTGATTVAAGTLVVAGAIGSSAVTVDGGALLGGTGTVGSVMARAGSAVQPGIGSAFGTLTVNGDVTLSSGSTFAVRIDPNGQSDRLAAGGKATLGGATLRISETAGNYVDVLSPYTILSAARGVKGKFGSVAPGNTLAFVDPTIVYGPSMVSLSFVRNATSLPDVAVTPEQTGIAGVIQSLGPSSPLYNAVLGQTAAGAQQAYRAVAGTVYASQAASSIQTSRYVSVNVLDRLFSIAGSGLDARQLLDQLSPNALPTFVNCFAPLPSVDKIVSPNVTLWGEGFGTFGSTSGSANAAGLDHSLGGFVIGADTPLHGFSAPYRVGVAGGYTNDSFSAQDGSSSGTAQSVFGSLYGSARYGSIDVRLGASYAASETKASRVVAFPGFRESEASRYWGSTVQGFGEIGYRFASSRWVVEPVIDAALVHVHQNAFHETGGAAALFGFAQDSDSASTTLGVRGEAALFNGLPLIARTFLGWRHGYGDINPSATFAFASGSAPFSSSGAPIDRDALAAEAGLDWRASSRLTLGASYAGQIGSHAIDNSVKGRVEYKF